MKKHLIALFTVLGLLAASGCSDLGGSNGKTFTILSGSENKTLEPLLKEIGKKEGYNIVMSYKGSVDSMYALQSDSKNYDAVWLANRFWTEMGDKEKKVKYEQSIMTSPVAFGISESKAKELGFASGDVSVKQILQAVKGGKLNFMMTSATQSNSGMSAYIGFINALLNNPQTISKTDLDKPELKSQIKDLLSGVNRTSSSSGWLKDLFLKGGGAYNAMVNYEAILIETNQQLVKDGKEPLRLVYPTDGLSMADFVLGYIDNGDKDKEAFFKKFQSALLAPDAQKQIAETGRRTGYGGVVQNADPKVFNTAWGIDVSKVLTPISFPQKDVVFEAMNLYQTAFKKPSYTIFALDYSGSMASNGGESQLKEAMKTLLDQQTASRYLLQSSADDVIVTIPFNSDVIDTWKAQTAGDYPAVLKNINDLSAGGGTDIYTAAAKGLDILKSIDTKKYNAAIILMTDGQSQGDISTFKNAFSKARADIPVFSIMFGDADSSQLNDLADLTRGKVFDGTKDLVGAFKEAKGYN